MIIELYKDLWYKKEIVCIIVLTLLLPVILVGIWIGMVIGGGQD